MQAADETSLMLPRRRRATLPSLDGRASDTGKGGEVKESSCRASGVCGLVCSLSRQRDAPEWERHAGVERAGRIRPQLLRQQTTEEWRLQTQSRRACRRPSRQERPWALWEERGGGGAVRRYTTILMNAGQPLRGNDAWRKCGSGIPCDTHSRRPSQGRRPPCLRA